MLLVLDDVWDGEVLDLLDVVPHEPGCKVLVTTRIQELLDRRHATKLKVPLLPPGHSWQLFCWHAFRGVQHVPGHLEEIARLVMNECGGLPLALKVIGGAFAGKADLGYWQLALEKFRRSDVLSKEHEEKLYLRLKLSMDELPSIHPNLQDFFFYFAAFPEDAEVGVVKDLLPLWKGEGIVGRQGYDPHDEAYELLGWLLSRSLIELHTEAGLNLQTQVFMTCKVHDVLRDLARHILYHNVDVTKRDCLYEAELKCFPAEWARGGKGIHGYVTPLSARRLSVMSSNLKELPQSLLDAPKLEVVILRHNPLTAVPESFLRNLRNLKVLDLSFTSISSLPSSVGSLHLLVVLNLSKTHLLSLPHSVGGLVSLEHLNLDNCPIKALPSSLSSLVKLRFFSCAGSGDVWLLTDLGVVWRMISNRAGLEDVARLVSLEELSINSDSQRALPGRLITGLKGLRKLHLRFPKLKSLPGPSSDDLQALEDLQLPRCQSLTSLPTSLESLKHLITINLSLCTGLLSLPAFDALPNLMYLDLSSCSGLKALPASFGRPGAFPALKYLWMFACDELASFPDLQPGAMPQLLLLQLAGWVQLTTLPQSLSYLTSLQHLNLAMCTELQALENDSFSFAALTNLEELDLDHATGISEVPASLGMLPRFRLLIVEGCPASIPKEVEQGKIRIVRKYKGRVV